MNCPFCNATGTKVNDSRLIKSGASVRRRRECLECSSRFTTYESMQVKMPLIFKKDGRRETYQREKLQKGIEIACQKLNISSLKIESIINDIEDQLLKLNSAEIGSRFIGNLVIEHLKHVNPVAFVRFASVYKTFKDVDDFFNNLRPDSN